MPFLIDLISLCFIPIFFIFASSPPILTICILFLVIRYIFFIATSYSIFLAIIIFLLYVSGLFVLFSYFIVLHPNYLYTYSKTWLVYFSIIFLWSYNYSFYFSINVFPIGFIFYSPFLLTFSASLLFLVMIIVIKIINSKKRKGPIRPWV